MILIMKKYSIILIAFLLLVFTSIITYNYHHQEDAIFRGIPLTRNYEYKLKAPFKEIFLNTSDGSELNGLYFCNDSHKGVVLFLHGRGGNLSSWGSRANIFLKNGYDILIIDYRGFGKSSSGFKEEWFLEDAQIAYKYLQSIYDEKKIIIYGQSLGSSTATHLASKNSPKMLILESPFYSMTAAASHTKPFLPEIIVSFILKYKLPTFEWIKDVKSPIYIFHGSNDTTIPLEQAQQLYVEINNNTHSEIIVLQGLNHNDVYKNKIYRVKLQEILNN